MWCWMKIRRITGWSTKIGKKNMIVCKYKMINSTDNERNTWRTEMLIQMQGYSEHRIIKMKTRYTNLMWFKRGDWVGTLFSASEGTHLLYNVAVRRSPVLRTTSLLPSQPKPVPIIHLGREEQVKVPCSRTQHVDPHRVWTHKLGNMSTELYRWATRARSGMPRPNIGRVHLLPGIARSF